MNKYIKLIAILIIMFSFVAIKPNFVMAVVDDGSGTVLNGGDDVGTTDTTSGTAGTGTSDVVNGDDDTGTTDTTSNPPSINTTIVTNGDDDAPTTHSNPSSGTTKQAGSYVTGYRVPQNNVVVPPISHTVAPSNQVAKPNNTSPTSLENSLPQTAGALSGVAQENTSTNNKSLTATVLNAVGDFLTNKYFLWFLILLLIITGALVVRERRNRN